MHVFFSLSHRGAQFDLFFLTEVAQFACFSPSLRRGNLGGFFYQKGGGALSLLFPTLQRGRSLHTFISLPERGATPHISFFTECFFLIPRRERNFLLFSPVFLFSSSSFFVVFNYGLPSGFEFKETRFYLYIM